MPTRIWANGNKAVAVANIKADAAAWFDTVDGKKVLRADKLRKYLKDEFALLPTETGITGELPRVTAAANSVNVSGIAEDFKNRVGLAALERLAIFPKPNVTDATIAAAVVAARAKTEQLAEEVTALYSWVMNDELEIFLRNFYSEKDVDSAVPDGVVRIVDTRVYRCVYRTDKGERSKASDVTALVSVDQNDIVDVTAPAPPVGRFVEVVEWYRSQSNGQTGMFQYCGEKTVASGLTYRDSKTGEELAEVLPSIEWDEPPSDLKGLRLHPSGFTVGYRKNEVCPSVLNRAYAYPLTWRKTTRKPITGIEVSGQTIFVGTQGEPMLVSGADPAYLMSERVPGGQPCLSGRSIVATHRGFIYAGADGLALCQGTGGTPILTREHFTKKQWEALNPSSIFAVEHDGCYYFWWDAGAGGSGCYSFGIDTGRLVTLTLPASSVFKNTADGRLYAVKNLQIVEVFGGATNRLATWRSPRIRNGGMGGFSYVRATSEYTNGNVTVRWNRWFQNQATGAITSDVKTTILADARAARLPVGKPVEYEIEVEGRSEVTELRMCSSSAELRQ